jgi:uncharacterized protein (TIGR00299 family) protein
MSRVLYVDAVGGAAGDMLLAALLDAGAREDRVREAIEAVVPGKFVFTFETVSRRGLRARWLRIESVPGQSARGEAARPFRALMAAVDGASLPVEIRRTARSILERIGKAEGRVHGVDPGELELHELGDDDTLLDVVGVAAALGSLGIGEVFVSSLPLGTGGEVRAGPGHGAMPLPAPVTLELLQGFDVRGATPEETVTPTAAAILSAVGTPAPHLPEMTLEAVGYGAGTRDTADIPNVVRVLVGTKNEGAPFVGSEDRLLIRELVVLETNLDDLTPELTADAVQALLGAGAFDAWVTPASMKKGRFGFILSALCEPKAEPALTRLLFETTSTFGVRSHHVRRAELARRVATVAVGDGEIRVKLGLLGDRVVSATPEHDDVAEVARRAGRTVREVYEEAAAAARSLRYQEIEG